MTSFKAEFRGKICEINMDLITMSPPTFTVEIDGIDAIAKADPKLSRAEIAFLCREASKAAKT